MTMSKTTNKPANMQTRDELNQNTKATLDYRANEELSKINKIMLNMQSEGRFGFKYYMFNTRPVNHNKEVANRVLEYLQSMGYKVKLENTFLNVFTFDVDWS